MLDLHVHLIGHQDRPASRENIREYLEVADQRGLKEIGFADHDLYWEELNLPLIREVAEDYPHLSVRVGLEVDYRPGEEDKIRGLLQEFPFDYVIGSVHEINGWAFDYPDQELNHFERDPDALYREYFAYVEQAARSRLFTTIGHLDLIKIFGVRPKKDVLELAAGALDEIAKNGLAVEVNTNGRYKPVKEFYPELRLIEEIRRRKIPFTLGSDAHEAKVVGRDLPEAIELLRQAGVKSVVGFNCRKPITYSLV